MIFDQNRGSERSWTNIDPVGVTILLPSEDFVLLNHSTFKPFECYSDRLLERRAGFRRKVKGSLRFVNKMPSPGQLIHTVVLHSACDCCGQPVARQYVAQFEALVARCKLAKFARMSHPAGFHHVEPACPLSISFAVPQHNPGIH